MKEGGQDREGGEVRKSGDGERVGCDEGEESTGMCGCHASLPS
jgi:hypothetical protein